MANALPRSGTRLLAGNVLICLLGTVLAGSAILKLVQIPAVLEHLRLLGFTGGRLTLIAMLEAISAVLFLVPCTRSIGLLLVSSYLGGAIATHVGHGQAIAFEPAVLLGLCWLGAWLYQPRVLWSFASED